MVTHNAVWLQPAALREVEGFHSAERSDDTSERKRCDHSALRGTVTTSVKVTSCFILLDFMHCHLYFLPLFYFPPFLFITCCLLSPLVFIHLAFSAYLSDCPCSLCRPAFK